LHEVFIPGSTVHVGEVSYFLLEKLFHFVIWMYHGILCNSVFYSTLRNDKNDWVKKYMYYDGARRRGKPKKIWSEVVEKFCRMPC